MRAFTILRKALLLHKDIAHEIVNVKQQISKQDEKLLLTFEYLKLFEEARQQQVELRNRKRVVLKI